MPINPTHADPHTAHSVARLVEALDARGGYAVTYCHEDGPLIGFVGQFEARTGDTLTFTEARTDAPLTMRVDQLVTAYAIDGPWMTDQEVSALV